MSLRPANTKFTGNAVIWKRREFLTTALATLAGTSLLTNSQSTAASPSLLPPSSTRASSAGVSGLRTQAMTIRQVIDAILADIPGAPFKETVDTIKSGDPDQPVKGIVTTMFATDAVIEKTIRLGANFIIAHEPTFYICCRHTIPTC